MQVFHSIRLAFLASFVGWLIQCPVSAAEPDSQLIPTYSVVVQDIDYYPIYKADLASNEYSGYLRGLYDFALPDHPNWNKSEKLGMELSYSAPVAEYHFRNLDATGRFETAAHLLPVSLSSYHLSSARHPDIINALADFLEQNPEIPQQLQEKYRFPALPSGD